MITCGFRQVRPVEYDLFFMLTEVAWRGEDERGKEGNMKTWQVVMSSV